MDFLLNHWEAVSSLLLSCVAITIAIISSHQTSKQAKEQIAGIKEMTETSTKNADKQIEEIKKMTNQMVIDTKKYLITMKSSAISLIENYLLNLESSIWSSNDEAKRINEILKNMEQDIRDADEDAKKDTDYRKYSFCTNKPMDELDLRLEYLDRRINNLYILKSKTENLLKEIKSYQSDDVESLRESGQYHPN